jgi:type II secretory pathway pseudopilin PulG
MKKLSQKGFTILDLVIVLLCVAIGIFTVAAINEKANDLHRSYPTYTSK